MGRKCVVCEKYLTPEDRVITKKILGFDTQFFYCTDCLSTHIDCNVTDLYLKIEQLKQEGCFCFEEERAYLLEAAMYGE